MNDQERQQIDYSVVALNKAIAENQFRTEMEQMMAQIILVLMGIVQSQDARIVALESLPIIEASKDAQADVEANLKGI